MTVDEIERLARSLIAKHLGEPWSFAWNRRKRHFGLCRYGSMRIELSAVLMPHETAEAIRGTILHEIAHALAGPEAGHGPLWRAVARTLGVPDPRARREHTSDPSALPEPAYLLVSGEKVVKHYFRHPGRKFEASLPQRWVGGDYSTLGTLKLVKVRKK